LVQFVLQKCGRMPEVVGSIVDRLVGPAMLKMARGAMLMLVIHGRRRICGISGLP
jgi:hypothetical protein